MRRSGQGSIAFAQWRGRLEREARRAAEAERQADENKRQQLLEQIRRLEAEAKSVKADPLRAAFQRRWR